MTTRTYVVPVSRGSSPTSRALSPVKRPLLASKHTHQVGQSLPPTNTQSIAHQLTATTHSVTHLRQSQSPHSTCLPVGHPLDQEPSSQLGIH
ncbi:hypothetical protein E2C01_067277 [Portunus trituberculatus]|uniref:Uncharacterized protein n=1 Tax=Portunus trituberculatus TaxID=210409 RepID=A0A5B7HJC8_PORTR|nr:hypothetical protein [Portunus trituberculatus]